MSYLFRTGYLSDNLDSRRNLNRECGYPDSLTITDYTKLYDRNPIAARVVDVLPDESWQSSPEVYEDENVETTTDFEQAWTSLGKNLRGEQSWYDGNEGNPIWETLKRADKLSGIGRFGIVLVGIDDGKELDQPVDSFRDPTADSTNGTVFVTNARRQRSLIYLTVLDESCIQTVEYETNRYSPRYRKPKYYTVDFGSDESYVSSGRDTRSSKIHWSRVVHIADNLTYSDVLGVPRMRPVINRLMDLDKLYGGSAEMYWRGALPGLSLETHPQLGGDITIDRESLREAMWNYANGLQRYLTLQGMTAKNLAPQVSDPTSQVAVQLDAICIKLGIPKRIFMGSERGELASSQDDSTWNDRLRDRQTNYVTPRIIIPFIDRLIQLGVLPEPQQGYRVVWPDPETLKPQERADIAVKRTDALSKYVAGQVDAIIDPLDYLTRVLEFPEDEAREILERASAVQTVDDEPAFVT